MLNILHVLQELAAPIKKEKIDLMAPYYGDMSPLKLRDDESRINANKESYLEWISKLGAFL